MIAIINTTLNKLSMLQYFIAEQTFFKYFYFPLTIIDTSHIDTDTTINHNFK